MKGLHSTSTCKCSRSSCSSQVLVRSKLACDLSVSVCFIAIRPERKSLQDGRHVCAATTDSCALWSILLALSQNCWHSSFPPRENCTTKPCSVESVSQGRRRGLQLGGSRCCLGKRCSWRRMRRNIRTFWHVFFIGPLAGRHC